MANPEGTILFAKLEALKDIRSKTLQLDKIKQRIFQEVELTEQEDKCLMEYKQEMDLLMQEKMAHVEELRQIHADINAMESVIKHAEEARNRAREAAKIIHNNDYQPLKHDVDRMRRDYLGLERLPELYEIESDITPDYFDRAVQKSEWRMDVRGEDLLPPLNMHSHGGHQGSNAFLAPQPLQGSSKTEPRPLPPAPGPPAPTFRQQPPPMKSCLSCHQQIHRNAPICPLCKAKSRSRNPKKPKKKD
ncbi:zinc finger C4H2 domain-containing protein [Nasonia vitripennis]|uniref:C4H2-type domain-containing protein n=1 Tax=Nasonia vitripennis TaxID=7425 RepID=A0A7M7G966_NASVI|nr:zinc finger C4H2 domain-containing protein [Nasonia vitripennis]